jgi:chemotaxis protein methyltransferase CheR
MALTTNTTQFFREKSHFEYLSTEMSRLYSIDSLDSELRIWCAASSSGQEPYSIAMTCDAYAEQNFGGNFRILATDIDTNILTRAAGGYYSPTEVGPLPGWQLKKYFQEMQKQEQLFYRVRSKIADHVSFAQLNLLEPRLPFKMKFHTIFARNVFIYFERELIDHVIARMAEALYPGGLLFLGHSESGSMHSTKFRTVAHAIYQRI